MSDNNKKPMNIKETLKQSLITVLELESIETKILGKLKEDLKNYELHQTDNQEYIFRSVRAKHIERRLQDYLILKGSINYHLKRDDLK